MKRILTLVAAVALAGSASLSAQTAMTSAEPFKLGTFEVTGEGDSRIGIVLRDELIVELNAANRALEQHPENVALPMPSEHARPDCALRLRPQVPVVRNRQLPGGQRPADRIGNQADFVHDVDDVRTLAPLVPGKMLNAAVNFYSHVAEANTPEEQRAAAERRRAERGIPYLFIKPTEGAVIGNGDAVVIPYGRDRIDWEVELATVIGRTAKYVSADNAQDYIFGYMVSLDISDRGGRPPNSRPGSDWLVGKGHDTFAPLGPWIVPKEFYGDPMENLEQVLEVDGEVMQRAGPGDMIHSIYELIEYGTSIVTMYPGDVLNNGTSGGTGAGTAVRGEQRFLQPGETIRGQD